VHAALETHSEELSKRICTNAGHSFDECEVRFGVYPCRPALMFIAGIVPMVAAVLQMCCLAGCVYCCCRRCGCCHQHRAQRRIVNGTVIAQNPLSEGLVPPAAAPAAPPSAPAAPAAPAAYPGMPSAPSAPSAYPSLDVPPALQPVERR
jgi:hypothetical protein